MEEFQCIMMCKWQTEDGGKKTTAAFSCTPKFDFKVTKRLFKLTHCIVWFQICDICPTPLVLWVYSLPLYLGTHLTAGGRSLILKCLPSNWEHCSSRKSFLSRGHGSVLQERNFILRPTQNLPPFLGLQCWRIKKWQKRHCAEPVSHVFLSDRCWHVMI